MIEVERVKQIIRRLQSNLSKGWTAIRDWLSWNGGGLRSRKPRIRRLWVGHRPLADANRVAVVVHYSRRGAFLRYFRYMVEQLDRSGFAVIIVSNSPKLDAEGVETLLPHTAMVLHRRNVGYDFGAWRDGIRQIPDLAALSQLLITNDSVFGPLHGFDNVLARCDPAKADVWGITENFDIRYHLQSYFLLFNNAVLKAPKFRKFWESMRYVENKRVVIHKYEIGLSQMLLKIGFRLRALHPYRELTGTLLARSLVDHDVSRHPVIEKYSAKLLDHINGGVPLNPTHFFWDDLITEFQCPFIKRDLLEKNPAGVPLLGSWRSVIAYSTEYPVELIEEYLQEASRNRVF
jgi:lipopolysaccharide biosynthesis protein